MDDPLLELLTLFRHIVKYYLDIIVCILLQCHSVALRGPLAVDALVG